MAKFRKQPRVVDATQWFKNGDHPEDKTETFADEAGVPFEGEGHVVRYYRDPDDRGTRVCDYCGKIMHDHGWIETIGTTEGGYTVCPGDWIITGIEGDHYPVKPDIFVETYETVDEDEVKAAAASVCHADECHIRQAEDRMNSLQHLAKSVDKLWGAVQDGQHSARSLVGDEVLNMATELKKYEVGPLAQPRTRGAWDE